MNELSIEAIGLAIGYRGKQVGSDIAFGLHPGELLCLLGPNGSGKTTLFRTLLGVLPPLAGSVQVDGRDLHTWRRRELARKLAYVPQGHAGLFAFTVEQVTLMGRTARMGRFATPSREDHKVALECLRGIGIEHLRERVYTQISGGERQLVLIARALAQAASILILDEPTASLDFGNQLLVLEHIANLKRRGIAVLMSTHQPEHALRVADRVALLKEGRIASQLRPEELTSSILAELYETDPKLVAASLPSLGGAS